VQAPTVTADTPAAPLRSPSAAVTTPAAKVGGPSSTATSSTRAPSSATTPAGTAKPGTGPAANDRSTASAGQRAPAGGSRSEPATGTSRANATRAASRAGGSSAASARRGGGPRADGGDRRRAARGGDDGGEPRTPAQRDRRLRHTVRALAACLTGLADGQRTVLVLRAGLGAPRSRSRGEVARVTGLSRARVRLAETRGLRRLRRLARTAGCGTSRATDPPPGAGAAVPGAPDARPAIPAPAGTGFASALLGSDAAPGLGVHAERRLSAPHAEGGSSPGSGTAIEPPDGSGAGWLSIPLMAMTVLSILALAVLGARRGRHRDRWDPSAPW
jgi:hypothetical protein